MESGPPKADAKEHHDRAAECEVLLYFAEREETEGKGETELYGVQGHSGTKTGRVWRRRILR